MITVEHVEPLASLIEAETFGWLRTPYKNASEDNFKIDFGVRLHDGRKFIRVDVGSSGKYMVEKSTGIIYGIKGYGVVHRGHSYGTLVTICEWNWGGYLATKK